MRADCGVAPVVVMRLVGVKVEALVLVCVPVPMMFAAIAGNRSEAEPPPHIMPIVAGDVSRRSAVAEYVHELAGAVTEGLSTCCIMFCEVLLFRAVAETNGVVVSSPDHSSTRYRYEDAVRVETGTASLPVASLWKTQSPHQRVVALALMGAAPTASVQPEGVDAVGAVAEVPYPMTTRMSRLPAVGAWG
jgi:hypothetical protein